MDVIVTCQGGDYTNEIYPQLRAAGWNGYWIDAATTLRMKDDAVIILDPVNRHVIDAALAKGIKNYIGGNCTVSLMLMALAGLFQRGPGRVDDLHDVSGRIGRRRAEHARAARSRWAGARLRPRACSPTRPRAILEIDREVAGILRDGVSRPSISACRWPAALIPWIDKDLGNGKSNEEWKGGAETNKILGRTGATAIPVDWLCVRVGAMRCHSQALTIKLRQDVPLDRDRGDAGSAPTNG